MHLKVAFILAAGSLAFVVPIATAKPSLITSCTIFTLDDAMAVGYDSGKSKTFSTANASKKIDRQGGLPDGVVCGLIR